MGWANLKTRDSHRKLHKKTFRLDDPFRVGFLLNGQDASRFVSQGQSKNLVLALKASEIKLFKEHTGTNPILLLDDITSELDIKRRSFLFRTL